MPLIDSTMLGAADWSATGTLDPVVIACAMEEEAQPFLAALAPNPEVHIPTLPADFKGPTTFAGGTIASQPVIVVTTGIGMTNAALAATVALTQVRPRAYILAGTTGGLGANVDLAHAIVADSALYHDADASGFGYSPGQIPQMPTKYDANPQLLELVATAGAAASEEESKLQDHAASEGTPVHVGRVSSSNSFVTAPQVPAVIEAFPEVLAVDMETAAAAQVCWVFGVPWVSVRAVSDMCDPNAAEVFKKDAPDAAQVSYDLVVRTLELMEEPV